MFAPSTWAQFNAQVSGTVTDTTGAVIGGATVTLTNNGTQVTHTATTSGAGFYSFNNLPPGNFTVAVTAANFKSSTVSGVTLVSENPRTVNVQLEVGTTAQTVTVNGSTVPALQTSNANISGTLDSAQLQRIPAYGRDPYELLRLTPGISGDDSRAGNGNAVFMPNNTGVGQSNSGIFQTENQIQISADGQRVGDNNYLLDGVSVNSLSHGGAAVVTPNIEAVGQITVITSAFSAEYGRNSGAQILTTTKNGTNNFHGTASFTYNEPGLNAFNRYGGPTGQLPLRVENKERDWAGGLGGPIWKDKLFFFISFEGSKRNNPGFETQFVETPEFRTLVAGDRPGGISAGIVNSPLEAPRINKVLPADCTLAGATQVSTVVLNDPNAYPGVNNPCNAVSGGLDLGSPTGGLGVYGAGPFGGGLDNVPDVEYAQLIVPSRSRGKQWNGRIDWYATPHDQFAGIAYFSKLDNFNAGGAAGSRIIGDIPFKPFNSAITGIYIHTFGANTMNELRANGTRFADNGIRDSAGVVDWGVPFINVQGIPFAGTNQLNFGPAAATTTPAIFAENTYEARDMVTHTMGSQTIRAGAEYRLEQDNDNLAGAARPTYAFNSIWSFVNDTPIFESISADPRTGGVANTARYLWDHYYGLFVQDDWKVNENLTLNMGLRWEYFEPLYSHGQDMNLPILGNTRGSELADAALVPHHHLWNAQHDNFSPRFGFAYTPPFTNQRMVVRGGFGMAYNRLPTALFNNAVEDGPGYFNFNVCCATTSPNVNANQPTMPPLDVVYETGSSTSPFSYAPSPTLATPLNANNLPASGATIEVYGTPANLKVPYSYLYSLEIQHELPWDFVATLGYQGSTGRHYSRLVNQNFLFDNTNTPFFASFFAQDDSNEYYNGMNAHLSKRLRHGFLFDAIYTWSKSMDQVSNGDQADAAANQTDPANNRTELGPSDYDLRNRFTVSGLWTIPGAHRGNGLVNAVTNGWQINGVYTYHTGFPFTPVTFALHGLPSVLNAATPGPNRPLAYLGGAKSGCGNSLFEPGPGNLFAAGGTTYFDIVPPPGSNGTAPGIGRNSFRGPCYHDTDISLAKEQHLKWLGDAGLVRFQANFYNVFNTLNLTPFVFSTNATEIDNSQFGQAQSADAGRVVELLARFQF
ncbi:MAG TPA: TonB-dependent receptor [Silvibacterium sp.]|nr:TonB-dependent receptor [Silvibacterium sp.]